MDGLWSVSPEHTAVEEHSRDSGGFLGKGLWNHRVTTGHVCVVVLLLLFCCCVCGHL